MTIHLAPDVETHILYQVESGRFADANAVLREAMRLLDERERRLSSLRAQLRIGIDELDQQEGAEWSSELRDQIRREADDLHRRGELPDPDVCP